MKEWLVFEFRKIAFAAWISRSSTIISVDKGLSMQTKNKSDFSNAMLWACLEQWKRNNVRSTFEKSEKYSPNASKNLYLNLDWHSTRRNSARNSKVSCFINEENQLVLPESYYFNKLSFNLQRKENLLGPTNLISYLKYLSHEALKGVAKFIWKVEDFSS